MTDRKSIAWNVEQIRALVETFEGKKLSDWIVGSILGYLKNIEEARKREGLS